MNAANFDSKREQSRLDDRQSLTGEQSRDDCDDTLIDAMPKENSLAMGPKENSLAMGAVNVNPKENCLAIGPKENSLAMVFYFSQK